jgi:hypothetical protein
MAYEKKDDLAYSLALKATTEFVEASRIRGYVSYQAYNNFLLALTATGNIYDVRMEHKARKVYPVINSYTDSTYKEIRMQFDYNAFRNSLASGQIVYKGQTYRYLKVASKETVETYTEKQILDVIQRKNVRELSNATIAEYRDMTNVPSIPNMYTLTDQGNNSIYTMNHGDEFNVIIRNKNTTIATVLFNLFTIGSAGGQNTRVFINYGGTVVSESYVN